MFWENAKCFLNGASFFMDDLFFGRFDETFLSLLLSKSFNDLLKDEWPVLENKGAFGSAKRIF